MSKKTKDQKIIEAAKELIDKIDKMINDSEYIAVWILYAVHSLVYKGPSYEKELKKLKVLLKE